MVSEVPKAQLLDGDSFSGHVFFSNINCQLALICPKRMEFSNVTSTVERSMQLYRANICHFKENVSDLELSHVILLQFVSNIL